MAEPKELIRILMRSFGNGQIEKTKRLTPTQQIVLHFIWWILGWWFVTSGYGVVQFYNLTLRASPALFFLIPLLAWEMIIIGPVLEYVYYKTFRYSLSSLTSLVLICFILAVLTTVAPFVVVAYVFTPLLPIFFESLTPLLNTRNLRQRIRLEFKISLFSFSIIDISLIAIEIILLQFA